MSTAWVEEFSGVPDVGIGGGAQAPIQPSITTQVVTYTATAGVTASGFNAKTNLVGITSDGICSFLFAASGTTPTATASNSRLAAGNTNFYTVAPGGKVSFVTNT